jgi:L-alanine-DL-glutamate epimerase-like enolase superfamily enzyme
MLRFLRVTGVNTALLLGAHEPAQDALCLVELTTDEALIGIALLQGDERAHVHALVKQLLVGEDPRSVSGLWQKLTHAAGSSAHRAAAALDVALWDLKAKANAEPLWKTLGGSRPRVNAHAGARAAAASDDLRAQYTTSISDYGFRGATLHVGADPTADQRHLSLIQTALRANTSEPVLILDAEQCWTVKDAIRNMRAFEREFDLAWVQAATHHHDFLGMKRLSNAIRSAVCGGEFLESLSQFLPHLHQRGFDLIQVNPARLGITGALQLAEAAFGLELPVVLCAAPGNIHAHLAGVLPNVASLEVIEPAATCATFTSGVSIEHGWAVAGDRPGHGLILTLERDP